MSRMANDYTSCVSTYKTEAKRTHRNMLSEAYIVSISILSII